MNATIRRRINIIINNLNEVKDEVGQMSADEQSKYDNLPDGIQESEYGDKYQEAADKLCDAVNSIDEAIDSLEAVTNE
jgi:hypothetical protein